LSKTLYIYTCGDVHSPKGLLGAPVQFLINAISNQTMTRQLLQRIYGCGPGQDNLQNSKLNVRIGKKGD